MSIEIEFARKVAGGMVEVYLCDGRKFFINPENRSDLLQHQYQAWLDKGNASADIDANISDAHALARYKELEKDPLLIALALVVADEFGLTPIEMRNKVIVKLRSRL